MSPRRGGPGRGRQPLVEPAARDAVLAAVVVGHPREDVGASRSRPAAAPAPASPRAARRSRASRCTAWHSATASAVSPAMCRASWLRTCTATTWSRGRRVLVRAEVAARSPHCARLIRVCVLGHARPARSAPSRARRPRRRTPARRSGSAPRPGPRPGRTATALSRCSSRWCRTTGTSRPAPTSARSDDGHDRERPRPAEAVARAQQPAAREQRRRRRAAPTAVHDAA